MAVTSKVNLTGNTRVTGDMNITGTYRVNGSAVSPPAASIPQWVKYTLTHSSFSIAATTNNVILFSLPAGGFIHGFKIKHSIEFQGGAITAYTVSLGILSNLTKFTSAFDIYQTVASTAFDAANTFDSEDHDNPTDIYVQAISTGDTLNQATQGSVDIWVLQSVAV